MYFSASFQIWKFIFPENPNNKTVPLRIILLISLQPSIINQEEKKLRNGKSRREQQFSPQLFASDVDKRGENIHSPPPQSGIRPPLMN